MLFPAYRVGLGLWNVSDKLSDFFETRIVGEDFEDIGLRNARLNFRQVEITHIMENIIYNELRIRGYKVDVGLVEHYSTGKIIIVSDNIKVRRNEEGITTMGLRNFLLDENSLNT